MTSQLLADAFYVDGGLTYTGAPATVISGLSHLVGKSVSVLADGIVIPNKTVSAGGTITLTTAASKVQVGLGYTSEVWTPYIEAVQGQSVNVMQSRQHQIFEILCRVVDSTYLELSTDGFAFTDARLFKATEALGLFTGDKMVPIRSRMAKRTQAKARCNKPVPCNLLAFIFRILAVED